MADQELSMYEKMLVIRRLEERVEQLFSEGEIRGTTHPAIGQEAVAVGTCCDLNNGDYVTSTHRGHGHFVAKGGNVERIMAELFGKETGYSGGRGGSQLMADYSIGFLGGNGITGGSIPVATGAGMSVKRDEGSRIVVCFLGDGASNQGVFHESLNMAALWQLPVVYVCENNQYAMSTKVGQAVPVRHIAERAAAYGMDATVIDGNDVLRVRDAVDDAAEQARNHSRPSLVECKTYRLSGHSRGDQRKYRDAVEEEAAWEKDPLRISRDRLLANGSLAEEDDAKLRQSVAQEIENAVQFASESAYPNTQDVIGEVFA